MRSALYSVAMKLRGASQVRLLGVVLALSAGCVHNGFVPSTAMQIPSRPEGCYLDMIFEPAPPFPYVILGKVTTDSTAPGLWALGEGNDVAMERLRDEACRVGAHGLMQAGSQSVGVWNNNGYSKSTTGEALAFVYVDAAGRPLPPPNGPRTVIHPGSLGVPPPPSGPPPGAPPPGAMPPPPPPGAASALQATGVPPSQ
jgi:hypothetical protein